MSDEQQIIRPASLGRALRKGFRDAYDHLGYVVAASFFTFIIASLVFSLGWAVYRVIPSAVALLLFIPAVMAIWLWTAGILYYVNKSVFNEHPSIRDTLHGIKVLLLPAILLFIVDFVITTILIGDAYFFFRMAAARKTIAFSMAGVFFASIALIWLMMLQYHLPLLVAQLKMESGPRVGVILRKSFLLLADNLIFTLGLFVVIIAFTALCILPRFIGIVVLYPGVVAFLLTHALRELFIKYGIVEEEPEVVEDKWGLPDSWMKRDRPEEDDGQNTQ